MNVQQLIFYIEIKMNDYYLTIAIPTYNGAERLPEVLERLSEQINTENFNWDVFNCR